MLTTLLLACFFQEQPPIVPIERPGKNGRGRDPWVFRCIFEDRTRMLIIAPAKDKWMAFNPETCAFHKIWQGKMDFRGKVWDFSQDNSRAEGRILLASPSEMWRLSDGAGASPGWTFDRVEHDSQGWVFRTSGSTLSSPVFSAEGWRRVFLAFDETSRKGRFRVDIQDLRNKERSQWFESALHVDSETAWQWNFKRIERPSAAMQVRITSPISGKRLRNLRMYGDRASWRDGSGHVVTPRWDGYETIGQTRAVVIRYRLPVGGGYVSVEQRPDTTNDGWVETFRLKGLPKGQVVVLLREGLSEAMKLTGRGVVGRQIRFDADGEYQIRTTEVSP